MSIPIVNHFLCGNEESNQYSIFENLDVLSQCVPTLKFGNFFRMAFIKEINSSSGAHGILEEYDVVLVIDGVRVRNDKTCNNTKYCLL